MAWPIVAGAIVVGDLLVKAVSAVSVISDAVRKLSPQLEDEVTVEVVGQPGATKQQLYFLALAAANGVVRRFGSFAMVPPAYGAIMIEYDAADHWVRATIRYRWSTITAATPFFGQQPFPFSPDRNLGFYNGLAVYRGPQCDVVGGTFDFTTDPPSTLVGIPSSSAKAGEMPILPFARQMILTGCPTTSQPTPSPVTQTPPDNFPLAPGQPVIPSPNPMPPGDNRSRGGVVRPGTGGGGSTSTGTAVGTGAKIACCPKTLELVPLVFAALSAPATNADMTWQTPIPGPGGF